MASVVLSRRRDRSPGAAGLAAATVFAGALTGIALTFPLLPAGPPRPDVDLGARSRLTALDGFDTRVRPAAIVYDPLHRTSAADVIPKLSLGVTPLQRTASQPVRVIHNGRFSLPAGTYAIDVRFGDQVPEQPATLSLQIGRVGPPLESWSVQPVAGETWHTSLRLPVDAAFVGLSGPVELERAIASISITPTAIVDAGARPRVPLVLAAALYPGASFYFHMEQMYPEPEGFWTPGGQAGDVTLAVPPERTTPVVLRIHSGARANTATLSSFGWQRRYMLTPGLVVEVELPPVTDGVLPLTISTTDGFSPRDLDPASSDSRFLGIWVEVKP